ncbi:class I SAM-dependent methyltransferase [Bradyrhizobium genosp. P]|uniref:class I SAM-dependent methyltransferase n=1 Tax=Bradyrhizobium genosp. P TaxID=83641 RepID=UPI003CEDCD1B
MSDRRQSLLRDDDAITRYRRIFDRLWHALGMQLRHPSGVIGSLTGWFMAFVNDEPNRLAVDALELQPTDRVLELGFGPGWALRTIAARATKGQIFGIDQSDRMLRQAANMNEVAIARGRVVLSKGPFSPLPWIDSTFQKVLLVNVAYFFDPDGREVAEVHRVLRPGGRVVVYVTSRETMIKWPFASRETHRLYESGELLDLLKGAGFRSANIEINDVLLPFGLKGLLATAVKSPYLVRQDVAPVRCC